MWTLPNRQNLGMVSVSLLEEAQSFGVSLVSPRIERGYPFMMGVKFDDTVSNPVAMIAAIDPWDGTGGTPGSWFK
jgi:hypothetical protein